MWRIFKEYRGIKPVDNQPVCCSIRVQGGEAYEIRMGCR